MRVPGRPLVGLAALLLGLAVLLLTATSSAAQAKLDFPALTGRVVDQANLLSPQTEQALTEKLAALEGIDPRLAAAPRDPLPFPGLVAASTNDPFGEQLSAQNLALDIGAAFSDAGEAGHINVASGHGPWPARRCSSPRPNGGYCSIRAGAIRGCSATAAPSRSRPPTRAC